MSALHATSAAPAAYAIELKDLRLSFGKTEIIRGANLWAAPLSNPASEPVR